MLYTQVDPERGCEVAYNRWYERDHFYAGCMIGPGFFAGRRWVATGELKSLRLPHGETTFCAPVTAGSYLAIYWVLEGMQEENLRWGTDQVNWLYANNRGFPRRVHAHTGMYDVAARWYRDPDPVPLELALDHEQYVGMVSLAIQPGAASSSHDVLSWLDANLPGFLAGSPVASVSAWANRPLLSDAPSFLPADPDAASRVLQLYFLESAPAAAWPGVEAWCQRIDASGVGTVSFAGPWVPTVVGTDTYTDQLW